MKRFEWLILAIMLPICVAAQNGDHIPTIDELISLKTLGGAEISPDGRWIAYSVREADFEQNDYISQIWLANAGTGETFQLTQGDKSASRPQWSPDSKWLTFTTGREGDKTQLYAIRPIGGEAIRLTDAETGISNYQWSRNGQRIAFTAIDPESKERKDRKDHMGPFHVVRREYRHTHLWVLDVAEALRKPVNGTRLTSGQDFSVSGFDWSPDGSRIAFSAAVNPDYVNSHTADIYVLTLADSSLNKLISQPGPDSSPHWSPDGKWICFSTNMGREPRYALNRVLAVVSSEGGDPESLTSAFDENPSFVVWNADGIYFSASQKTASHLFRLDPKTKTIKRISKQAHLMAGSFSITSDGERMTFTVTSTSELPELFVSDVKDFKYTKLTDMTAQIRNFKLAKREVISWKSKDGTEIEGILVRPRDFDPSEKRPLLCVIHGGPTGIDRPAFRGNRNYPVDLWTDRGAIVLRVNYRGSAGYGEAFRTLNIRNLGVGDAWDVLSGVDYLVGKGWIDPEQIGCMGWSQGGYISAFLTTSSDKFAAISVGAGISNWSTYYYNTDITPFTIQYLGDDPADDPEIYRKTSPMSYIQEAKTPTLIQHGEFDKRVPIPNGYELRQGLEDRGVPVEMVVYEGFGHGISTPRSQRAVMWHNLVWFNHYLWGDPLPDLWNPDLPEKTDGKDKTEE